MMKILYVIPALSSGGIEKMVEQWIRQMQILGHQCDVLSFSNGNNQVFRTLGCTINICPFSVKSIHNTRKQLERFFNKNNEYDVVHCNVSFSGGLVCFVAKKANNRTVTIAHAHSNGRNKYSSLLSGIINSIFHLISRRLMNRYCDVRLACSYAAGDYLFSRRDNYHFFPNAIDTDSYRFSLQSRVKIQELEGLNNSFVILHIGRFSKEKNHAFLLKIFHELVLVNKRAVLLLLGNGELYEEVKECVDKDELISDKVHFLGYRNNVSDYLKASDVFVLPSTVEGFPVSVVEAQASGIPCVVSEATPQEASVTDLVTHVSLSESPQTWASKILQIRIPQDRVVYNNIVASKGFNISESVRMLIDNYYKQ